MFTRMAVIRILFVLLFANASFGQINFFKLYSDDGDDAAHGIVELEDSSYVITGSSSSFFDAGAQAFLLKIDSLGNYLWSNHYGGAETEVGKRVLYTKNVGFFIAGHSNSYAAQGYDFYLAKTDEAGTFEWDRTYGGSGWERVHDAEILSDTTIVLVGETSSTFNDNTDMYIVRTDKNGDTLWTQQIGTDFNDKLTSIHVLNDTTFYVAGSMFVADSARIKGCVIKMHRNGQIYWTKTYGYRGNTFINDINIANGELVGVGHTDKNNDSLIYEHYFRLDLDGNMIRERYSNSTGERIALAIVPYSAPNKYYVAYSFWDIWSHPEANDIAVSRFSDTLYWEATAGTISHYAPDYLNHLIPTSDGGAIFVGATNSDGLGYHHACVVKIGPNETYPYCLAPHILEQLVSVDETLSELGIEIYPNPASESLSIQSNLGETLEIEILNGFGQIVQYQEISSANNTMDISHLNTGMYFVKVMVDGKVGVQKLVVE